MGRREARQKTIPGTLTCPPAKSTRKAQMTLLLRLQLLSLESLA